LADAGEVHELFGDVFVGLFAKSLQIQGTFQDSFGQNPKVTGFLPTYGACSHRVIIQCEQMLWRDRWQRLA
jgi:hypothetical protein